ncbi:restriction endonuclease subunit S [Cellulosimicrobium sp. 22601]|uniref:restriction endonuclease subunit S n=1 Tax=unclassified Cellulosimicrobium TaxID=2624466 RepID=UPI003F8301B8
MKAGWTAVALGDVVRFQSGGTPARGRDEFWNGDLPWITGADIAADGSITPRVHITSAAVSGSATAVAPPGTLLLVTRTSVGKNAVTTFPVAFSQDITAISPSERVDLGYLRAFLGSRAATLANTARGATIKGITREVVAGISMPLPPLDEQRRIARALDHVEALRLKRKQTLDHLLEFPRALVQEALSHQSTLTTVGSIAEVATGSTPSRANPQNFGSGIPWVKTTEVTGDVISSTSERVTADGVRSAHLRIFPETSLVLAMYGQGSTRGRVGVLGLPATTNQACAVILANPAVCNYRFLFEQLKCNYEQIRQMARGGNQANLNLSIVRSIPVSLPSLDAQREFARRMGFFDLQARRTREHVRQIDDLFESLRARALAGELDLDYVRLTSP